MNEITISLGSNVNPSDNLKRAGDLIINKFNLYLSNFPFDWFFSNWKMH